MENPISQKLNESLNPGIKVLMQGFFAMMRGESAQSFLQDLAKSNLEMQKLDFTDPYKTAEQLYSEKGQDINAAKSSIMDKISQFMKG